MKKQGWGVQSSQCVFWKVLCSFFFESCAHYASVSTFVCIRELSAEFGAYKAAVHEREQRVDAMFTSIKV